MSAPINPPELDVALKSLWGARELPFGAAVQSPYASDPFKPTRHRREQLVSVRACGLLHHLAQRAIEEAAAQNSRAITTAHVQRALELLPWVAQFAK
jgi:hypothetical protein